jgi:hypothetical protein
MAAQQFSLIYSPDPGDEVKKDVTITATLLDPLANQIYVGFGTSVPTRRGTEIISAIDFLSSGIRDRNLIDRPSPDFLNSSMVTMCDIDQITDGNRRTAGDLATAVVTDTDVVIGMAQGVTEFGYKVFHETYLEQLKRAVIEWLHANG